MNTALVSTFGKSGNSDLTSVTSGQVKPMTYTIDDCHFLARCPLRYYDTARTSWLSVKIM